MPGLKHTPRRGDKCPNEYDGQGDQKEGVQPIAHGILGSLRRAVLEGRFSLGKGPINQIEKEHDDRTQQ